MIAGVHHHVVEALHFPPHVNDNLPRAGHAMHATCWRGTRMFQHRIHPQRHAWDATRNKAYVMSAARPLRLTAPLVSNREDVR